MTSLVILINGCRAIGILGNGVGLHFFLRCPSHTTKGVNHAAFAAVLTDDEAITNPEIKRDDRLRLNILNLHKETNTSGLTTIRCCVNVVRFSSSFVNCPTIFAKNGILRINGKDLHGGYTIILFDVNKLASTGCFACICVFNHNCNSLIIMFLFVFSK